MFGRAGSWNSYRHYNDRSSDDYDGHDDQDVIGSRDNFCCPCSCSYLLKCRQPPFERWQMWWSSLYRPNLRE